MTNEKRSGLFETAKFFLEKIPETLHDHFENVDGSLKQISEKINNGVEEILPINELIEELKKFNNNLERLNSNIEGLINSPFFQELGRLLWHANKFGLYIESMVKELRESHSHSSLSLNKNENSNIRRSFK